MDFTIRATYNWTDKANAYTDEDEQSLLAAVTNLWGDGAYVSSAYDDSVEINGKFSYSDSAELDQTSGDEAAKLSDQLPRLSNWTLSDSVEVDYGPGSFTLWPNG